MSSSVTVHSNPKAGGHVALTIEVAGADSAALTVRSWSIPDPPQDRKPKDIQVAQLWHLKASDKGDVITCDVNIPGTDPRVTCTLGGAAGKRAITVAITNTFLGLGNRTDTYPLSDLDHEALVKLVLAAKLPPLGKVK